jgi:signal transduction histidine kinase
MPACGFSGPFGSLAAVALRPLLESTLTVAQQDPVLANVSVELKGDESTVQGDGEQLSRVFLNRLLNAAQAMDGRGQIEVNVEDGERHCAVSVRDTGPGIPSEVRERLFEPFVTTKRRGTGLGLATAKRTVDLQGGNITVDVPADGGTTVTVVLPAAQALV